MTNGDRPANSLTKRELFAKDAPSVPTMWFKKLYEQNHPLATHEEIFWAWRLYFADEMLKQLGEPR